MTDKNTPASGFDLDAILNELEDRALIYRGNTFVLPGELPADVVSPFLAADSGLIELLTDVIAESSADADWDDMLLLALKKSPTLPRSLLEAAGTAFCNLLGHEQHTAFTALKPSVAAYMAIARGVFTEYGASLTDFFGSAGSSGTDGDTSNQTSSTTTESTPETSGDPEPTPVSSE